MDRDMLVILAELKKLLLVMVGFLINPYSAIYNLQQTTASNFAAFQK